MSEANNTLEEYNVTQVRMVTFTGGSMFTEYEKNGEKGIIDENEDKELIRRLLIENRRLLILALVLEVTLIITYLLK